MSSPSPTRIRSKKQSAREVVSAEIHATEERLNKRLDSIVALLEVFIKLNNAKLGDLQTAVDDVSGQMDQLHEEFAAFVERMEDGDENDDDDDLDDDDVEDEDEEEEEEKQHEDEDEDEGGSQ